MSNIEFDTDQQESYIGKKNSANYAYRGPQGYSQTSGMAAWLMRQGLVTTEGGAKIVLAVIIILDFVAAGLIIYFFVVNR